MSDDGVVGGGMCDVICVGVGVENVCGDGDECVEDEDE